jgi:fused signal recognition particle receptor
MSLFKKLFGGKKEELPEVKAHETRLLAAEESLRKVKLEEKSEEKIEEKLEEKAEIKSQGLFSRLKEGLTKTRKAFSQGLGALLLGRKVVDEDLLDEIETLLLSADIGVEVTEKLIKNITERLGRQELKDSEVLMSALREDLLAIASPSAQPLKIKPFTAEEVETLDNPQKVPFVILMIGVNGAGKTTTIGKLAKRFISEGKSVLLAAGDTFRAAAVEQLKVWGERNGVSVIAQGTGADSAAVIFDALMAAKARNIDVVIADTAGRLHNKANLMAELAKVRRVMNKFDPQAPHEVMLVLDAGNGQNSLVQAQQFHQTMGVTGITLTKLDGTAKGGIVFAIAEKFKLPIRFIGVGESVDDLQEFNAEAFVSALFE